MLEPDYSILYTVNLTGQGRRPMFFVSHGTRTVVGDPGANVGTRYVPIVEEVMPWPWLSLPLST